MHAATRRAGLAALLAVATALGAAACQGSESPAGPGTTGVDGTVAGTAGPVPYTAYRDPADLAASAVAVGARFGILLEPHPAQGTRWALVAGPDLAVLTPLGTEIAVANTVVPGSPDTQIFSFAGRAPGTTQVTFEEVHADGSPVADRAPLTFTVAVTPDGLPPTTIAPSSTTTRPGSGTGTGTGTGSGTGTTGR